MSDFYSRSTRVKGIRVTHQHSISNSINRRPWGKRIHRHQCRIFGRGLIDRLQAAGGGFVVFPGHVFQAVTHHMDDTQLDMGLREDAVYRIRETLQTVHTGNQDVLKARFFSSVSTLSQNFVPSFSASHIPSNSFWPSVLIPSARKTALLITLPF